MIWSGSATVATVVTSRWVGAMGMAIVFIFIALAWIGWCT